ncbi:hypothetical protein PVAP13_4NG065719 [Panicum virgatum]|uniref:Uncharacterized protein n=1 Tax=Panicum virgatum TaxID=38727 RepID=A0A8T0T6S9_PANVG|nr:hypothetical protein PVAP13_4NG065719 [Panicum virgatum]
MPSPQPPVPPRPHTNSALPHLDEGMLADGSTAMACGGRPHRGSPTPTSCPESYPSPAGTLLAPNARPRLTGAGLPTVAPMVQRQTAARAAFWWIRVRAHMCRMHSG